jgi:hypothetical protein
MASNDSVPGADPVPAAPVAASTRHRAHAAPAPVEPAPVIESDPGFAPTAEVPDQPEIDDPKLAHLARQRPVERVAYGSYQSKLSAPQRPGFRRYWANDRGNRIAELMARGYIVVTDPVTKRPVTQSAGTLPEGGGMRAILMEIPIEFYQEDFGDKQERLNEVDRAIYTGRHNQDPDDRTYVPKSTPINVQVTRGMGR